VSRSAKPHYRNRAGASVSGGERETPAADEVQASARARSEPVPLLHPWERSGAAGATEFHGGCCTNHPQIRCVDL
jgi:hypothetical protein